MRVCACVREAVLQFYPRCFMTTDAIYNDEMGAVKYHFVISQVRVSVSVYALQEEGGRPRSITSPTATRRPCVVWCSLCVFWCSCVVMCVQMVCWASPDAVAQAADDAKAVKWMTLPQLRKINVSLWPPCHAMPYAARQADQW